MSSPHKDGSSVKASQSTSKSYDQASESNTGLLPRDASLSSSGYAPARQPYISPPSSSLRRRLPAVNYMEPSLDHTELAFLRTVGRTRTPIAAPEDIQLNCVDRKLDTLSRHGATMQVHRGTWKGRKVAFKYIRRAWFPDGSEPDAGTSAHAYRQDMYDLNFELEVMSKASLQEHPNITKLLAVCFDTLSSESGQPRAFAEPGLIVELAHEHHPDLASFFDDNSNPDRPPRLPYDTGASLIADIADGVQVLHDHELVHADLKPGNVLLFVVGMLWRRCLEEVQVPGGVADNASRCGLTAKIADFGFVGMVTYTNDGRRVPKWGDRPRGGTPEWNSPECLKVPDPLTVLKPRSLNHPQYKPSRDIYSFGLLAAYIALDGQSPKRYTQNLTDAKLADEMLGVTVDQIDRHYGPDETVQDRTLKDAAIVIARATLALDPQARTESLRSLEIRNLLFNDTTSPSRWRTEKFVLGSNALPQSVHEFQCSGLHDAYWKSPPGFREKVLESFRRLAGGQDWMVAQPTDPGIWALLEAPGGSG
ncbi:hypothetical protein GP486_002416 [Trichoglossum hirsutum]|uniref:Protein kinase domain-containing protein n=1 Tax=Trichoglossum hirsutum TaxID=265104 RepID=A0A9P8LF94_9PEZI|nr:hypothetical protein GP486_002416 [Trichoglossum hirsutum]